MGTAVVGVVADLNPGNVAALVPVMHGVAVAMVALAYVFAIALGVPYVARWFMYPQAALDDLRHPVVGALYATFPAGLLVLASATAAVGPLILTAHTVSTVVAILAIPGSILAVTIAVVFGFVLFVTPDIDQRQASGGWFIPPVVTIVIPLALVPLIPVVGASTARFLFVASYAVWGMGFFLFLLVAALLYQRHVYHALPAPALAPSIWIGLGPIGVGGLTLIRMAQVSGLAWSSANVSTIGQVSQLGATALWGFGLWWLPLAILVLLRYHRAEGLPYGIGWWAFTFPLGAYTALTIVLARTWDLPVIDALGVILALLLSAFWLIVTTLTVVHMRSGLAWKR
jgi:C4-dicarboxylate transporter/malic acid transport protein